MKTKEIITGFRKSENAKIRIIANNITSYCETQDINSIPKVAYGLYTTYKLMLDSDDAVFTAGMDMLSELFSTAGNNDIVHLYGVSHTDTGWGGSEQEHTAYLLLTGMFYNMSRKLDGNKSIALTTLIDGLIITGAMVDRIISYYANKSLN